MDLVDVYLFVSPASIFVAVVAITFLLHQAWPHLSRQKEPAEPRLTPPPKDDSHDSQHPTVTKEPEIPEGFWTRRDVFDLERRALFSKSWLYLAHAAQFTKPGAYQSFDVAGYPIFLIRGKDDKIRAFHNVCRHRAYTITRKECGASTVLGCRYHGWSYDTRGRLVKAPQFDGLPGFEKAENGLFEIHVRTTESGMVFVNLDSGSPGSLERSTLAAVERFARDAEWICGRTLTGRFNWKSGINPRHFADFSTQLEKRVSEALSPARAKLVRLFTQRNKQARISLFPATFLYSFNAADLWLSLTFLPATETTTHIRYDLFTSRSRNLNENDLTSTVERVIQSLIEGIESEYSSHNFQPDETAYTRQILACLQEHSKLEKAQGAPILPAMRRPKGSFLFQQAEQLCKELDCLGASESGGLDW